MMLGSEAGVASVVSGEDIVAIVLNPDEAQKLTDLLYENEGCGLEDLTNAMLTPVRPDDSRFDSPSVHPSQTGEIEDVVMHPVCKVCGKYFFAVDGCKGHHA